MSCNTENAFQCCVPLLIHDCWGDNKVQIPYSVPYKKMQRTGSYRITGMAVRSLAVFLSVIIVPAISHVEVGLFDPLWHNRATIMMGKFVTNVLLIIIPAILPCRLQYKSSGSADNTNQVRRVGYCIVGRRVLPVEERLDRRLLASRRQCLRNQCYQERSN